MTSEDSNYLITRLQEAFAIDQRVGQLDIEIRIEFGEVTLRGHVLTPERKKAAETIAREMLPDHRVYNDLQIVNLFGSTEPIPANAIRVAAVGDVHFGLDSAGQLRKCLEGISEHADLLLVAGDLTRHGEASEAKVLADDLEECGVPVVAVLGNHDHHCDQENDIAAVLTDGGISVLEGTAVTLEIDNKTVGIAGTKGFGGGFAGARGSEFGERIQKEFIAYSRSLANNLRDALNSLESDIKIALTHFSPVEETLRGERLEIYPWLGTYLLAEAIDATRCDIAFHGHAHGGSEEGVTAGGVPVRNVAQPVIKQPYKIYCVEPRHVHQASYAATQGY